VSWCDVLNNQYLSFTNWPALNQVVLSDTEDALIAIKPLGTLGIALYKETNIFVGIAQAGPPSQAFRFEHRGHYAGPAGVNALVDVDGAHIYMTRTGRVGYFDGAQHQWLCDGVWPFIQQDIDITFIERVFGVYDYNTAQIYFWYPRSGDNGLCTGMLIINIPFPLAGISQYAYFLGQSNFACAHGTTIPPFSTLTQPLIYSSEAPANRVYHLDATAYTDRETAFPCRVTTGLFKPDPQGTAIIRPIVEIYTSRDESRGAVAVTALTTNALETDGTFSNAESIDLTKVQPNEYIGFNDTGSFVGIQLSWDSTAKVEYKGAEVYGRLTT